MQLSDFRKGMAVFHAVTRCNATVVRAVQSRGVVTIELTEGPRAGSWHDANPVNLQPVYPTELTPIGEQLVIPGCERQPAAGKLAQLSLFGG